MVNMTTVVLLTIFTLHRLLKGWWKQYYLLTLILALGLASVVPITASWAAEVTWLASAQRLYWILSLTVEATLVALVLQLIARAGKQNEGQAVLVRWLAIGSLVVTSVSVLLHYDNRPNTAMSLITRDLTFLTALLNMVLWRFLLQNRKRDPLVVAVSAGVGIQCTGEAIGHSLKLLAKQARSDVILDIGNVLIALAALVAVFVWNRAFAKAKFPAGTTGSASPSPAAASGV